jgi:hypothetical protein
MLIAVPQELNSICRYITAIYMQQGEQVEQRQYLLAEATYGNNGKKLHWVVVEKHKRQDTFLKSKPVDSLCGINALQIVEDMSEVKGHAPKYDENWNRTNKENDSYFFYYPEDVYVKDLEYQLERGYIRHERRRFNPKLEWEFNGQKGVGRVERVPVTIDLLVSEMWCKECQKKKAELYPDL